MISSLVVLLISGAGWYVWSINQKPQANSEQAAVTTQKIKQIPDDVSSLKTIDEIKQQASTDIGENAIVGIELELEDGKLVYSIHLANGTTLFFDASTGEKIALQEDNDDEIEDEQPLPQNFSLALGLDKAIEIARKERPGKVIVKVEIELEDGEIVYSIRFSDKGRVIVSADNGAVIEVRQEDGKRVKVNKQSGGDDDFDEDGIRNNEDEDNDDDRNKDSWDRDDDNDDIHDDEDEDDDNDDIDDDEDEDSEDDGSAGDED
ncbi:MAG: PepSY domain-containing protein [Patescibacteria group bacterium]